MESSLEEFEDDDDDIDEREESSEISDLIKNSSLNNLNPNELKKIKKSKIKKCIALKSKYGFDHDGENKGTENDKNDKTKLSKDIVLTTPDDKFKFVAKSADKRFGKFDQEIGFGSFKRVFRGFDFNEGREVAWNSINVSEMDESELDRIRDEINIMKRLNHPNIINYISGWFDNQKNEVVIITEIICGGSLKKHLHKIINPRLKLIKSWIKEILRGLQYLHKEVSPPIVHRDIKCDNIYIDSTNGRIKIGDLGLSKIQTASCTSSFAGTEEFMAPEVFQAKYSVLADIYSLGMCILEMVSGEKPYKEYEGNILKIYECSKNGVLPKSLDRLKNEELKKLIIFCLKPEYERPSAEDLLNLDYLNDLESDENKYPVEISKPEINIEIDASVDYEKLVHKNKNLIPIKYTENNINNCNSTEIANPAIGNENKGACNNFIKSSINCTNKNLKFATSSNM